MGVAVAGFVAVAVGGIGVWVGINGVEVGVRVGAFGSAVPKIISLAWSLSSAVGWGVQVAGSGVPANVALAVGMAVFSGTKATSAWVGMMIVGVGSGVLGWQAMMPKQTKQKVKKRKMVRKNGFN